MHFASTPLTSLAYALFFASAQASYLQSELSFGHSDRVSPNGRGVPNFHLEGIPHPPEILSNRIVLTPPAPGNQRGAAWSERPLTFGSWTVDIDFRATGPERGGGNLQIWYARDGQVTVGTSSIYTVGKFDGLALVIDQYAGSAGFIRGFLNDGTTDYKSHHSVDSLAFGHCDYSYRNLGRPSRIQIKHSALSLRVDVDGRNCFESDKIGLPLGYNFGISAASAENPDSFEVFKFVTTTENHIPDVIDPNQDAQKPTGQDQNQNQGQQQQQQQQQQQGQHEPIPAYSDPPEAPSSQFQSSSEQFADLHNRLQSMMKHINVLNRDHNEFTRQQTTRHAELISLIRGLENRVAEVKGLKDKVEEIQRDLRTFKGEFHNSLDRQVAGLRGDVRMTHSTISSVTGSVFKFLLLVVFGQASVVGAYMLYKRRKANSPKKYL